MTQLQRFHETRIRRLTPIALYYPQLSFHIARIYFSRYDPLRASDNAREPLADRRLIQLTDESAYLYRSIS